MSVEIMLLEIKEQLERIQQEIRELRSVKPESASQPRKQFKIDEAAKMLGRSAYTCREWARHGRINAIKLDQKRGVNSVWAITASELERIKNDGLLPVDMQRNHAE